MANTNPTGKGGEETRFKAGASGNPGGRTPTAWLREFLSAACDKSESGQSRRQAIAEHMFEVATSYEVIVKGHGEEAIPIASAKDSIEAGKVLFAYDMGKPVESLEVNQTTAPRVVTCLPVKGSVPPGEPPKDLDLGAPIVDPPKASDGS